MAKLGGAKGFWDIIKSVSVAEIAREANRPLSVAVVGTPERRAEAMQRLFAAEEQARNAEIVKARALPEPPFVQGFDGMSEEAQFPRQAGVFDLVIDVGGGREGAPEGTLIYSVVELGGWEQTLDRILEDRPELALPLARNFPVFRKRVAQRLITQTATANAQFALVTGVAEALPITAILLPVNSLSDIVILTKNQVMLTLRLAAAYGLSVDYKSRMKELAPILANAFGWRAIARELVGAVPFIGFLPRAMIAYAGTVTVGKAAQFYYETGETVTTSQVKRLYQEAYEASREKVRALAETLRGGRGGGGGGGRKRLPAKSGNGATPPEEAPPALEAEELAANERE
jgi:uncharacterized protein (DUF697 family)